MNTGDLVKKRRKELKITQAELADGICTQAMISKIERNELNTSMAIMKEIAERLQVPLSYFSEEITSSNYENTDAQLRKMIRRHLQRREYESIAYLLKVNSGTIDTSVSNANTLFFEWIRGILYYYFEKDSTKAIQHLTSQELSQIDNDLAIEVLDSIGVIYYEIEDFDQALHYFEKGIDSLGENTPHEIKAKVLFNYALCLKKTGKIESSLHYIIEGIDTLVESNSFYLLGDFFYQKGLCLEEMGDNREALDAIKKAVAIFEIQKNDLFETKSRLKLQSLEKAVIK